ncbi:tetratricopeptide repeat protein [Pedobacter agri]|uniref:Tetratricopeptide repeat protein n=1 Tax=Pedobacter agri TaxID=454586 RepID=A0A9X3DIG5_9SPHI|nr:hypothetical protein [Pedobacter agri]MCX3265923.1 hypothetical protein [Pedobacter agri]
MKKRSLTLFLILSVCQFCFSQTQDIKDLYWDFLQIRLEASEKSKAINLAEALIKRSSELNQKQTGSVNYHLARLYEETDQMNLAIPYYEKSIKLTPGYYVPYLALGNHYFKDCQAMIKKMNAAVDAKSVVIYGKMVEDYKKLSTKTAAYLEKSYACDPDDSTKGIITYLYQTSKNNEALKTFDVRIKKLAGDCITLLDDE